MTAKAEETHHVPVTLRCLVLLLLGLAAGSAYLTRHCIAVANTQIQGELNISDEQMGWVFAAFSAGYFFFQIPGGWLGNRIGTRAAFPLISIAWSLLTMWSSLVGSWIMLAGSRVAFGAAQAGLVPLSAKVINDWFHESLRGLCSAVVGASMSVGGVIAMGLTANLIEDYHWRDIFRVYSLVGIVWAVAFYFLFRTYPANHPWVSASQPEKKPKPATKAAPAKDVATTSSAIHLNTPELILRLATNRTILGINVQSFFRAAGYGLLVTWFPAFLEYRFGVTAKQAGTLAMYPLAGVIVGSLLGGALVDGTFKLTGSKWISRVGCAVLAMLGAAALTFASSSSATVNGFVILMTLASVCAGFGNPPAWAATMDVSGRYTAVIMGTMNMSGTIGGFTMPVVLGYLIGDIRATGGEWNLVIYFVAAIYLAGAVSWVLINPNDSPEGRR